LHRTNAWTRQATALFRPGRIWRLDGGRERIRAGRATLWLTAVELSCHEHSEV